MLSLMFNSFDIFCKVLNTFPSHEGFGRSAFVWDNQDFYRSLGKGKKIGGSMVAIELAEPQLFHSVRNRARSQEL